MTSIQMPQLGETIVEGTILKWLKNEGDAVEADEPLFEISTDKVDTEVPSPVAGHGDEAPGRRGSDGAGRDRGDGDRRRLGNRRQRLAAPAATEAPAAAAAPGAAAQAPTPVPAPAPAPQAATPAASAPAPAMPDRGPRSQHPVADRAQARREQRHRSCDRRRHR